MKTSSASTRVTLSLLWVSAHIARHRYFIMYTENRSFITSFIYREQIILRFVLSVALWRDILNTSLPPRPINICAAALLGQTIYTYDKVLLIIGFCFTLQRRSTEGLAIRRESPYPVLRMVSPGVHRSYH